MRFVVLSGRGAVGWAGRGEEVVARVVSTRGAGPLEPNVQQIGRGMEGAVDG